MSNKKVAVLVIDGQIDFCKPTGSLYVPGAEKDMERLSKFILNHKSEIDFIGLTMDSHQVIDISHPSYWEDKDGVSPNPFTIITSADVEAGKWSPRFAPQESLKYLKDLESQGEYPHCIWPEHCIIGTEGAAIVPELMNSVKEWARQGKFFQVVAKGTYPTTEHFGAFRAQVPVMNRPETQLNQNLIQKLESYQKIYFAGEAKSHCVASTLKQAMEFPTLATKFIILEDCMSPVPGFETLADPIYEKAKQMGIKFATTNSLTTL